MQNDCFKTDSLLFCFTGCHAAEKVLKNFSGNVLHENVAGKRKHEKFKEFCQNVRENLFSTFFRLKHHIPVASEGQNLNRFVLFLKKFANTFYIKLMTFPSTINFFQINFAKSFLQKSSTYQVWDKLVNNHDCVCCLC